jgi:hypothetical protein
MMSVLPGPATGSALVFGFLMVPLLALLSHGALRIGSERNRFVVGIGLCIIAWVACVMMLMAAGLAVEWHDAAAGLLILATASVAFGILWSLVCWGFTTSLLAALCDATGPIDREAWFRAYGGGSSIEEFVDDRLSILLGSGIAESDGLRVGLSGRFGRFTAAVVRAMRRFYGLPAHE